jgi:hypothetical protein
MSRLESFIRRMSAQRDVIDHVAQNLPLPDDGAILEIGLGNGRTFDHLREKFPGRRIVAFDRALGAHSSSTPPPGDLVLGEIVETARAFAGTNAALVHADIGTGYDDKDAVTLTWLPDVVARALGMPHWSLWRCPPPSTASATSSIAGGPEPHGPRRRHRGRPFPRYRRRL